MNVDNISSELREDALDSAISRLLKLYEEVPVPVVRQAIRSVVFARTIELPPLEKRKIESKVDKKIAAVEARMFQRVKEEAVRCASCADRTEGDW